MKPWPWSVCRHKEACWEAKHHLQAPGLLPSSRAMRMQLPQLSMGRRRVETTVFKGRQRG